MEVERLVSPLIKIIDELGGKDVPFSTLFPILFRKGFDLPKSYQEMIDRVGLILDGKGGLRFPYPDEVVPFWWRDDVADFYGAWVRQVVLYHERREEK